MLITLPSVEEFFGHIALITSLIGLLPQIYKAYLTKSTQDISSLMLFNYVLCSVAWIVYGYYQKADCVVWSNIVGLLISLLSIMQKYYYDAKQI